MLNYENLKALYRAHGPRGTCEVLRESLADGTLKPSDFSLRGLAQAFMGDDWLRENDPNYFHPGGVTLLQETGSAVDVAAFSNITGQILYNEVHAGWAEAQDFGDRVFKTVPTQFQQEKIAGVGRIAGRGSLVRPGKDYPEYGFSEHYWNTPAIQKRGGIVSVTMEAVIYDRIGEVLPMAREIGRRLRRHKAIRQCACIAGLSYVIEDETFAGNNHKWNGTTYNTYQTAANALCINKKTGVTLTDWTQIEAQMLLFAKMTDPDTGEPLDIRPKMLIVMPARAMTALRIVTATQVRHGAGQTDGTVNVNTYSTNPLIPQNLEVVGANLETNLLRYVIMNSTSAVSAANVDDWWFLLEPFKSFHYMEKEPLNVFVQPPNSPSDFDRDIPYRFKARELGEAFSRDPRYTSLSINA